MFFCKYIVSGLEGLENIDERQMILLKTILQNLSTKEIIHTVKDYIVKSCTKYDLYPTHIHSLMIRELGICRR